MIELGRHTGSDLAVFCSCKNGISAIHGGHTILVVCQKSLTKISESSGGPEGRGLKARLAVLLFLLRDTAINCEKRLANRALRTRAEVIRTWSEVPKIVLGRFNEVNENGPTRFQQ